jgi:hypothetical protein
MLMTTIALFGAGGKMGVRLSKNLQGSPYRVRHVEPGAAGRKRLKDELGIACVDADSAVDGADVVILAVPDTLIGKIGADLSPRLKAGTMVMTLDAAAPFAGHLPARDDLVYFVAHPCHPTIFSPEVHTPGARLLRRRDRPAVDRQRADAGPRRVPSTWARTSPRPSTSPSCVVPRHGRADGAAGAGPVRDRVRHAAGRDARSHGRGGVARRARRMPRATSCWAT